LLNLLSWQFVFFLILLARRLLEQHNAATAEAVENASVEAAAKAWISKRPHS
jgi:hypothetical protein